MNRRELLQLSAALAFSEGLHPPLGLAEEPKQSPDEMIHKYLAAETERINKNVLDGAKTKAEWEAKRPKLKQQFLEMAGLWPLPAKTDLKAKTTGEHIHAGVVVENVHFQSKPGLYVTGNLYRPKSNDTKLPAILYVCGHSNRGRDGNKTAYQDRGLWFANNGYVCLAVDTLQLGEVAGIHHGTYGIRETKPVQTRFWWHSRGYTPAGVECWNGIRAIDYLCSRPEVDPEKIGVTGISGGGATTVWMAAADDRVKVAVPVSGMSDLESYVTNKVINGHCDCMFIYNTYQWEWTTILAPFAPKPLLFANSDMDPIFPMDGNRRIIARLRKCYEMLGAKDKVEEYVSHGGHAYRPDLRIAIFGFINKHLKGVNGPVQDAKFDKIPGQALRVFPTDADLPKDAINSKADETFVPKAVVKLPAEAKDFKEWKAGLVKQLQERVFKGTGPRGVDWIESKPDGDWLWVTSENLLQVPVFIQDVKGGKGNPTTLVVLNDGDNHKNEVADLRKRYPNEVRYAALYPRGIEQTRWTRKSPPNTVARSLALIGQTVDSGRMWDVMTTCALLHGLAEPQNRVVGRGVAGILAAYAGLFAHAKSGRFIQEVVILDPPTSHRDGPHFLNVMRVLDIPEALGLLAPDIKLTLLGKSAKDKAFDKTAAIYKLAGAADKFKRG